MADSVVRASAKRTRDIFGTDTINYPSTGLDTSRISTRLFQEYNHVRDLPPALAAKMATAATTAAEKRRKIKNANAEEQTSDPKMRKMIEASSEKAEKAKDAQSMALTVRAGKGAAPNAHGPTPMKNTPSSALVRKDVVKQPRPEWHAPWRPFRVISGHMGWVRSLAVEPDNQWFASGAADRTIKIWDIGSGTLKLTLTGHISAVRGLAVSPRHPYLFSCGEDKQVKWYVSPGTHYPRALLT